MSTLKIDEGRLLQVLVAPIISEKATDAAENRGQVLFKVLRDATKPEIKAAVESLFQKKVVSVNTANYAGKKKRERRADFGRRPHWKKAIVTLKEGEKLDLV